MKNKSPFWSNRHESCNDPEGGILKNLCHFTPSWSCPINAYDRALREYQEIFSSPIDELWPKLLTLPRDHFCWQALYRGGEGRQAATQRPHRALETRGRSPRSGGERRGGRPAVHGAARDTPGQVRGTVRDLRAPKGRAQVAAFAARLPTARGAGRPPKPPPLAAVPQAWVRPPAPARARRAPGAPPSPHGRGPVGPSTALPRAGTAGCAALPSQVTSYISDTFAILAVAPWRSAVTAPAVIGGRAGAGPARQSRARQWCAAPLTPAAPAQRGQGRTGLLPFPPSPSRRPERALSRWRGLPERPELQPAPVSQGLSLGSVSPCSRPEGGDGATRDPQSAARRSCPARGHRA